MKTNGTSPKAAGQLVAQIAHSCGSSDALAVYEHTDGSVDGYCWSCEAWVRDPYQGGTSVVLPKKGAKGETVSEVYSMHPVVALPLRGISIATTTYFGVRASAGSNAKHFYPRTHKGVLVSYKVRVVGSKQFFNIKAAESSGALDLFGAHQACTASSRVVYVTEGELDCMSVYQAIVEDQAGTKYAETLPAVVSLNAGAGKEGTKVVNAVVQHKDFFDRFRKIVIVFDQDEPGKVSAQAIARLWPERVEICTLPAKDANELLMAGRSKALARAVMWEGKKHRPSGLVTAREAFEVARKKVEWGLSWPWPSLTKLTYGIQPGMLIGVGAGVGGGKTTWWHELEQHLIHVHKKKIGVFMLEEPNAKTLKKIASRVAGKNFCNPDTQYAQSELDIALESIGDNVILYNHAEDKSWASLKESIRHLVLVEGCLHIIIDPISAVVAHLSSSDSNDELNAMFGELAGMAETLGFTLYYSSHLNPPDKRGTPHEEGGRVKAAQFTGSRAMIKWSHYIIGLERNTQEEDPFLRNTTTCRILKDREHGNTGNFPIVFDPASGSFTEAVIAAYQEEKF